MPPLFHLLHLLPLLQLRLLFVQLLTRLGHKPLIGCLLPFTVARLMQGVGWLLVLWML